uniref:Uncharacterized protein n=1 Tax=Cryptomonas curvata TaxID=233186 RepID=A0A7S0N2Y3_9CRYP
MSTAELSQNETVPSSHSNSVHVSFTDSLASDNTFAVLAAEAQSLLVSSYRSREIWSSFASVCSSASTVTSSTTCSYPTLPAASSFGLAPSFDFARLGTHHAPSYPRGMGIHHASPMDPSQQCSLSVGSGYALDADRRWQEPSAVDSQELEEYSLGSGYPG